MTFRVKFGMETADKTCATAPTVGQVKTDPNLKAQLGYGDNIRVLMNGTELNDGTTVQDGSTLVVETRANQKAG